MTTTTPDLRCSKCEAGFAFNTDGTVSVAVYEFDGELDYIENYCSERCYKKAYPSGDTSRCRRMA